MFKSSIAKFAKRLVSVFLAASVEFFIGCENGGKPSVLAQHWIYINGTVKDKPDDMELFKDGTGVLDKNSIIWKIKNKRLILLSGGTDLSCRYKVSGYELTLSYDDGGSAVFVKKEKFEEVKAERNADRIKRFEQQFVPVKGGTFTMGCTNEQGHNCWDREMPAHSVTVDDFYICKYEVTQGLWEAVMGGNPSNFIGSDDLPAENVSWEDAQAFIQKLNLITGKKYRLPTEAEWEFAARGGNNSGGYIYSGSNNLNEVGWYGGNSGNTTQPAGQKIPNELGIYDMSGNVWELVNDRYGGYSDSAQTNPAGPDSGSYYVNRGGSWNYGSRSCRVTERYFNSPSVRGSYLGLRIAFDAN